MKPYQKFIKKFLFIMTAVFAGICLFLAFTAYQTNKTLLDAEFHKQLFDENHISTQAQKVLSSSMKEYMSDLKKNSPNTFEQYTGIFSILEKSLTPEMVKINLDSMRQELFQYFKGQRKFLPDIYLSNPTQIKKDNVSNSNDPTQALTKIDKINLSAILLYINRSDISDTLFELKFIYYAVEATPSFSLLLFLFFFLAGLVLCVKPVHAVKWMSLFLLSFGFFSFITGIGLTLYNAFILPENISPLAMSLPLGSDGIANYLKDCISPISRTLSVIGFLLMLISLGLFYLPIIFRGFFSKTNENSTKQSHKRHRLMKRTAYLLLCLVVVSAIFYKVNITKIDFEDNDFATALSKLKNTNTVTEVISATREALYVLNIKLVDNKTKMPIPNTQMIVSGKSSLLKKSFNEIATTDDTGVAKYTLDKGSFRVSFFPNLFPTNYQIPSPIFMDMKSPGTTLLTINLDMTPENVRQKWGIAEIELLDKDNKPVPNIELSVQSPVYAPGYPDHVFSYTDSEGIASFKLNEGNYTVGVVDSNFPVKYQIPIPINIYLTSHNLNRYTLRLVDVKKKSK